MSLQIFIAHSGDCLQIDLQVEAISTLTDLKSWLGNASQIIPEDQVLLTLKGRQIRPQAPLTEPALFLYDRTLFSKQSNRALFNEIQPRTATDLSEFPSELSDQTSLRAWQSLFVKRKEWAYSLLQHCRELCQEAEEANAQQQVIQQAGKIATINVENRVKSLEQKVADAIDWSKGLDEEVDTRDETVQAHLKVLEQLQARPELLSLAGLGQMLKQDANPTASESWVPLITCVNRTVLEDAARVSHRELTTITQKTARFESTFGSLVARMNELAETADFGTNQSQEYIEEPSKLQHEIEVTVNKIGTDCERITTMRSADPKAPASASKVALQHTKSFLPAIRDYQTEMLDLLNDAVSRRQSSFTHLRTVLQSVAALEADVGSVSKEVATLQLTDKAQEAFEDIATLSRLPTSYGQILLESVRRSEWLEKLKRDSAMLAEEVATYREEEQKRRRKWLKDHPYINPEVADEHTPGVEISLQGQNSSWTQVSRQDVSAYIRNLQGAIGMQKAVQDLSNQLADLDKPTRQQTKRAKAFRMGSVHEAGFGRGSLLLRGEDETRVLKEANAELEAELKTHKSRVRKLEDLLHRQSQAPRLPSFNDPFGAAPPSPFSFSNDDLVGKSSSGHRQTNERLSELSRRLSSNERAANDSRLKEQIERLTADLASEREAKAALVEEMSRANAESRRQISEINSTKQDLMENMDAQQREFSQERRALEQEVEKTKAKLEEAEDELDRLVGSRDNERSGINNQLQVMRAEFEEVQTASRERAQQLQEKLRQQQEVNSQQQEKLQRHQSTDEKRKETIGQIIQSLSPGSEIPLETSTLFATLNALVENVSNKKSQLAAELQTLQSELTQAKAYLADRQKQAEADRETLDDRNEELANVKQRLDGKTAMAASLTTQLDSTKSLLEEMRAKFADGDAGSEALRSQLAEQGAQLSTLSFELVEAKSQVSEKQNKISSLENMSKQQRDTIKSQHLRLQTRAEHVLLMSTKYTELVDRLRRLLDSQGFIVGADSSGKMLVQRAPKSSSTSVTQSNLADESLSIVTRRTSLPLDGCQSLLDKLRALLSETGPSLDEEKLKFKGLVENASWFDLDLFCDSVAKRLRDIEYTARKWQKEARGYRDRAHKYHADAQEKIAYRAFKEGDLALFLPTRNQVTRPWAAFNVGAPHFFLREQEGHRLGSKEWLVARITKVQEKVVKLKKTSPDSKTNGNGVADAKGSPEDDNPFELSDGLRWYLLDAVEEKPGAPSTPGLGKAVVAAANVDARGSIRMSKSKPSQVVEEVNRQLSKSLESRRSSNASKRSAVGLGILGAEPAGRPSSKAPSVRSNQPLASPEPDIAAKRLGHDQGRSDQLLGP